MSKNGFTGTDGDETAGVVHEGQGLLHCTCGGTIWVTTSGDLVTHSEPLDVEDEHIVVPFWSKSIWRYELVE